PVFCSTSITGASTYTKAAQVDRRAALLMAPTGLIGSVVGALATKWIDPALLLLVTAALLGWPSVGIMRRSGGPTDARAEAVEVGASTYAIIGIVAGVVSGLLGIGG